MWEALAWLSRMRHVVVRLELRLARPWFLQVSSSAESAARSETPRSKKTLVRLGFSARQIRLMTSCRNFGGINPAQGSFRGNWVPTRSLHVLVSWAPESCFMLSNALL